MLASIRRAVLPGHGLGIWHGPHVDAPASTWSEYLCGVADRDENRLVDWRYKHSLHPRASTALHLGCSTLQAKAGDLPAIRGLVHADLLLNHLVGPDNSGTAVFDQERPCGRSAIRHRLDCALHSVVSSYRTSTSSRPDPAALPDDDDDRLLALYELHIAVASVHYMAFAEDLPGLESTADRIAQLLFGEQSL